MTSNRHPADELAAIRTELRLLEQREAALRDLLRSGECGLEGDEYIARINTRRCQRLDVNALRKHLGTAGIKPFLWSQEIQQVRLDRKDKSARG